MGTKKENVIEAKEITNVKPDSDDSDFLKKQATPVAFTDEQFGKFELDKSVNNFNGIDPWIDTDWIELYFDENEQVAKACLVNFNPSTKKKREKNCVAIDIQQFGYIK